MACIGFLVSGGIGGIGGLIAGASLEVGGCVLDASSRCSKNKEQERADMRVANACAWSKCAKTLSLRGVGHMLTIGGGFLTGAGLVRDSGWPVSSLHGDPCFSGLRTGVAATTIGLTLIASGKAFTKISESDYSASDVLAIVSSVGLTLLAFPISKTICTSSVEDVLERVPALVGGVACSHLSLITGVTCSHLTDRKLDQIARERQIQPIVRESVKYAVGTTICTVAYVSSALLLGATLGASLPTTMGTAIGVGAGIYSTKRFSRFVLNGISNLIYKCTSKLSSKI